MFQFAASSGSTIWVKSEVDQRRRDMDRATHKVHTANIPSVPPTADTRFFSAQCTPVLHRAPATLMQKAPPRTLPATPTTPASAAAELPGSEPSSASAHADPRRCVPEAWTSFNNSAVLRRALTKHIKIVASKKISRLTSAVIFKRPEPVIEEKAALSGMSQISIYSLISFIYISNMREQPEKESLQDPNTIIVACRMRRLNTPDAALPQLHSVPRENFYDGLLNPVPIQVVNNLTHRRTISKGNATPGRGQSGECCVNLTTARNETRRVLRPGGAQYALTSYNVARLGIMRGYLPADNRSVHEQAWSIYHIRVPRSGEQEIK
ncbi:hypothetical protein B0H11DRAFT_1933682 [Mycena galericulata]|nr:hypothetical protein B0H11DRAFT_1933682 [Mycena galericulata]